MTCKILTISKIQVIYSNILNVYHMKKPSFSIVDVNDMHVPPLTLWGWHVLPYVFDHVSYHALDFVVGTSSFSTNVASNGCGNDTTSGTTNRVDGTSISVIRVSSTSGEVMLVDHASLKIGLSLVSLPWVLLRLVYTPFNWGWSYVIATTLNGVPSYKGGAMDDISYW